MQCGYFSSKGLIYSSVLRSAQHGLKKVPPFFSLKDSHTTSSPNGQIVFSACHFLFPPLSSPCPTLMPVSEEEGEGGRER